MEVSNSKDAYLRLGYVLGLRLGLLTGAVALFVTATLLDNAWTPFLVISSVAVFTTWVIVWFRTRNILRRRRGSGQE